MKITDLFQEDANADIGQYRIAQQAAQVFAAWLNEHNAETPIKDCGFTLATFSRDAKSTIWLIPASTVGLADKHLYLGIGHDPNKPNQGGYVNSGRTQEHDGDEVKNSPVYLVMMISRDPADEIDVGYQINWEHFAHEYIHVLDYRRGLLNHKHNQSRSHFNKKKWDRIISKYHYYDKPEEFNAYYQQGLHEILNNLAREAPAFAPKNDPEDFRKRCLTSYASFLDYFRIWFDPGWFNKMMRSSTPTEAANKRKFNRRFFKFFELVRQKWPDMQYIKAMKDAHDEAVARYKD